MKVNESITLVCCAQMNRSISTQLHLAHPTPTMSMELVKYLQKIVFFFFVKRVCLKKESFRRYLTTSMDMAGIYFRSWNEYKLLLLQHLIHIEKYLVLWATFLYHATVLRLSQQMYWKFRFCCSRIVIIQVHCSKKKWTFSRSKSLAN